MTEALRWIEDEEMSEVLRGVLEHQPLQEDRLQEAALFSLQRLIGENLEEAATPEEEPVQAASSPKGPAEWKEDWQRIIDHTVAMMDRRYDAAQKKDAEFIWKQFIGSLYPDVPLFRNDGGWCAALEYLTARLHGRPVTFREAAQRYGVSVSMVSRYARRIDSECDTQGMLPGTDGLSPSTTNI